MTAHDHREVVPGCYRCELNSDEVRYRRHPEWHRVKADLLDRGWARVRAQPDRTEGSARGIFHSIARECDLPVRTTLSRRIPDCIVGWVQTLVDDDFNIQEL